VRSPLAIVHNENVPRDLLEAIPRALLQHPDPTSTEGGMLHHVMAGIGDGFQIVEDFGFEVLVTRTLQGSYGVHLDRWGAIVGERRNGLPDDWYREIIKSRAMANAFPFGKAVKDAMIILCRTVTRADSVLYTHLYHGGFSIRCNRETFIPDSIRPRVGLVIERAIPLGKGADFYESLPTAYTWGGGMSFSGSGLSRLIYTTA